MEQQGLMLKCELRPLEFGMYTIKFTDAEVKELKAIFPDGVCDYSKPGENQVPTVNAWHFSSCTPAPCRRGVS